MLSPPLLQSIQSFGPLIFIGHWKKFYFIFIFSFPFPFSFFLFPFFISFFLLKIASALCTLRGEVSLALESRNRATFWLSTALQIDPNSYDAFFLLSSRCLLPGEKEGELVKGLKGGGLTDEGEGEGEEEGGRGVVEWVRDYYGCAVDKYDVSDQKKTMVFFFFFFFFFFSPSFIFYWFSAV